MTIAHFAKTITIFACLHTPALADELWQQQGEWSIQLSDAGGCYASRTLEDGSLVHIGTEPSAGTGFFAIYNTSWTHLVDGQTGSVEFDFGDERFGGDSQVRFFDGVPGGYAPFDNPAFVDAFASKYSVRLIGGSGAEFDLDLTGTSAAVKGVFACQDANK